MCLSRSLRSLFLSINSCLQVASRVDSQLAQMIGWQDQVDWHQRMLTLHWWVLFCYTIVCCASWLQKKKSEGDDSPWNLSWPGSWTCTSVALLPMRPDSTREPMMIWLKLIHRVLVAEADAGAVTEDQKHWRVWLSEWQSPTISVAHGRVLFSMSLACVVRY